MPAQQQLHVSTTSDEDCSAVEVDLVARAGGSAALGHAIGRAIRRSYDQVYDGKQTGRFHWAQLSKTEKTNAGSLVEIWLARELGLSDGSDLDFRIAGHEVDCKFSQRLGGWMLPPEVLGHIAMLVTADDYLGTWSLGLLRITPDRIHSSTNRDAKATLNASGRADIRWIFKDAQLPPNALLRMSTADAIAVMSKHRQGRSVSGQERLDELFRRAQGLCISRTVIATVAQQEDPMKRVRSNGGSRSRLAAEGYLLLGHYRAHRAVARALGVPEPNSGEIVSIRVAPAESDSHEPTARINDTSWRLWRSGDDVVAAPPLAHAEGGNNPADL
jgi:hypothetical protein